MAKFECVLEGWIPVTTKIIVEAKSNVGVYEVVKEMVAMEKALDWKWTEGFWDEPKSIYVVGIAEVKG